MKKHSNDQAFYRNKGLFIAYYLILEDKNPLSLLPHWATLHRHPHGSTLSSYSKGLRQVRYGKNKDHEHLAQINLTLLFGQQSCLPFYYRKLAGNIPDVKTLRKLLADMNTLGYEKIKAVLDRAVFSAASINDLYKHHMKFLIAAKLPLKIVRHIGHCEGQDARPAPLQLGLSTLYAFPAGHLGLCSGSSL